jgi:uncharacterized protein (DUF952 family)
MDLRLFHITTRHEFEAARASGEDYRPAPYAREGFIHCSYGHQVEGTAARHFVGRTDLVLLEIDRAALTCAVVDENLSGGAELFPHVYGPLPIAAVTAIYPFSGLPPGPASTVAPGATADQEDGRRDS